MCKRCCAQMLLSSLFSLPSPVACQEEREGRGLAAREARRGGQVSRSPAGCLIRPLVRYAEHVPCF